MDAAVAAEVEEKEAEETGATVEAVNGLDERAVASMVAMMVVAVQLLHLGKHPEWEALCPEKKERLVQLANKLLTGDGLCHLQGLSLIHI